MGETGAGLVPRPKCTCFGLGTRLDLHSVLSVSARTPTVTLVSVIIATNDGEEVKNGSLHNSSSYL